jgi:endonuclease/exonuclease/phosphatase family metal-dependent hydrolase
VLVVTLPRRRTVLLAAVILFAVPPLAVVVNGTLLAARNSPVMGLTGLDPTPGISDGAEVTVLAYNIAKGSAHLGGLTFEPGPTVEARLRRMAAVIREAQPDLVFLSEVLEESPCPVAQAAFLARATGMHAWAFGEHYNLGVPGYRIVGGNAVLSRGPLEPVAVIDLPGRRPFWVTSNNRRALVAAARIGGERVLLAALHLDSVSPEGRLNQARRLVDFLGGRPAVLAGDFNAEPGEPPIELLRASSAAALDGPPTYPAESPEQRIDLIFAPAAWELIDHRVLECDASDHLPAVSTFRVHRRRSTGQPARAAVP